MHKTKHNSGAPIHYFQKQKHPQIKTSLQSGNNRRIFSRSRENNLNPRRPHNNNPHRKFVLGRR